MNTKQLSRNPYINYAMKTKQSQYYTIKLSLSIMHSAILKRNGKIYFKGYSNFYHNNEQYIKTNSKIIDIYNGAENTALLYSDRSISIFGFNSYGQTDLDPQFKKNVKSASLGYYHTLLLYTNNTIKIIGSNHCKQSETQSIATERVIQTSLGAYHTALIYESNEFVIFGSSIYGQSEIPDQVNNQFIEQISCGGFHTAILTQKLYANQINLIIFGSNYYNQSNVNAFYLTKNIKNVTLGGQHSGILYNDGSVKIFGDFKFGQSYIETDNKFINKLSMGYQTTGVIYHDGSAYVWGNNQYGICEINEVNHLNNSLFPARFYAKSMNYQTNY